MVPGEFLYPKLVILDWVKFDQFDFFLFFRSYFFWLEFLEELAMRTGYSIMSNSYVHRRTINKKEGVDVGRVFVQSKFCKAL